MDMYVCPKLISVTDNYSISKLDYTIAYNQCQLEN